MKLFFNSIFFLFLFSCGPVIKESVSKTYNYLPIDSKIAILDLKHPLPNNVEKIGIMSFRDSGFSTDCSFNSNLSKAKKRAREIGANIVKITELNSPDIISSCYRINVAFYKYDGNVSDLQQITLQLK